MGGWWKKLVRDLRQSARRLAKRKEGGEARPQPMETWVGAASVRFWSPANWADVGWNKGNWVVPPTDSEKTSGR